MPLAQRAVIGLALAALLFLGYRVLQPFLAPIAWAVILTYLTWPLYVRLKRILGGRATWSALAMTLFLTAAILLPLVWLAAQLQAELAAVYRGLTAYIQQGPQPLPEFLARIPWLGKWLQALLDRLSGDVMALEAEAAAWLEYFHRELAGVALGLGRFTMHLVLILVTVFFLYRDGERFQDQAQRALHTFLGARVNVYFSAIGATTKAVVYGLVAAGLAQGGMAGIGYWAAGLESPLLLATFTTVIALLPIPATFIVWSGIGLWLMLTDRIVAGAGLVLWGAFVVSWVDNLVRPLVISSAARIPFLLVMFGVLGGLVAFGVIGLFLGPVTLAVLLAVWQGWLENQASRESDQPGQSSMSRQVVHGSPSQIDHGENGTSGRTDPR
ncbi:MAG: AI-2E family transporter [Pseudomonadota bacterium]